MRSSRPDCRQLRHRHPQPGAAHQPLHFAPGTVYHPDRSLLPLKADNLLVAGRCISATHEAQASIRILPIVATLGQAAGVAAAVAHHAGVSPREASVAEIQRILTEQGAFIG